MQDLNSIAATLVHESRRAEAERSATSRLLEGAMPHRTGMAWTTIAPTATDASDSRVSARRVVGANLIRLGAWVGGISMPRSSERPAAT